MMIVKLLTLAAVAILSCEATIFQYPASGLGCVLVDITTNNNLEWTDSNGTKTSIPSFSFANSSVFNGGCGASPVVTVQWAKDLAQFSFTFKNIGNSVMLTLTFTFIPDNVFENGQKEKVTMTQQMSAGTVGSAYTCDNVSPIEFIQTVGADTYKMTFRIMKIKIQGFGVRDNKFSGNVKECDEKKSSITTKPTTKPTPTSKLTTKPTNATTKPTPTTKPTNATTKPTPKTKPTNATTKPTPTTKPTNATTKPTPTTKPTNATTKPTPTTKPTNATTKPTPTTQPTTKPTTPLPPAKHPKLTFKVMDGKVNCIMFQAQMLFTVPYPAVNGKTTTNKTTMIGLQDPQNITGECNTTDNTNMLSVQFYKNWMMDIAFATGDSKSMLAADDSSNFWWKNISLTYTYDKELFPDDLDKKVVGTARTVSGDLGKGNGYEASKSGSYICNSDTTKNVGAFSFETWNLQYNAFQTSANQTSFSTDHVSECSADVKTNSIVPIAVGAALAGLVVIVLIAYLIGRRRNRKGYESV